ncbi:glycerol-3-phosphate dehydrogenase [Massilia sp. CFBP9012]|uniref:glycerol-3-phosphate dehydrogenase n=1 Tax=Massilia sp. CFBP9012 TaxID=3096531 RepID=UPI002A6B506C|nr:glycerol-3-phosphate dehydrogenase [Massilia sp. CFBP9012]MDY0973714.1 glycerol-3-phosphate dehydrogenase [Massilia sp. CFBP9012]
MGADTTIDCDLLVVGGGINGAGIARDAAGRGLAVVLCEKDDLGAHTSSASSKLIHGGLRYLEYREFGLVRKALAERETLLRSAPHIMRPLRFVMPHVAGQRPAWLIRAGLFLYDRLAPRAFLPASSAIELVGHRAGAPLKPEFTRAFAYSDGWVDDARLVVLNALDAHERGARVLTHAACEDVVRRAAHWEARIDQDGAPLTVRARGLVNAAGPWAARFAGRANREAPHRALRLIKGSHIVVPRLFEHSCAYLFQHADGRVVFAIPYEEAFTLVGTTDVDFAGDPGAVAIGEGETHYLCALANRYFKRQLEPSDVVWSYSGVRPLLEDDAGNPAAITRDYFLEHDAGGPPLLSVFGGKITTYRKLAEEAVDWIAPLLGKTPTGAWTAQAVLPGGDLFGPQPDSRGVLEFDRWVAALQRRVAWLPKPLALRYARAYGTRVDVLLGGCQALADLGFEVAPGLYEAELRYLMRHEWARSAADVLWRRTKLGLHLRPGVASGIDAWMAAERSATAIV